MATKSKKEFCDDSRSRIDELFACVDDVQDRKMCLSVYGEKITFEQLQAAMIDQPPFIKTKPISPRVDLTSITKCDVDTVHDALDYIQCSGSASCVMQYVCMKKFEEVTFFDSAVKGGKLIPPRMTIDVGTVAPNSSVRINTGYVFKMPSKVKMMAVQDGSIVRTTFQKQPSFVIVPQIHCDKGFVIPTIYARDPEDTGIFTVNFTTLSGEVGRLRVVFKAYRVVSPRNQVSILDPEQPGSTVFKPKDQNTGRLVNNPKPKIVFESMSRDPEGHRVVFKTYDSTQKTPKVFDKQRLCIERLTTLMVSRKREWNNGELVSLSGVFMPSGNVSIAPKLARGSEYTANTHCLTFVDNRVRLFSTRVGDCSDVKVVNGAFSDTESYGDVSKAVRKVIATLNGLSVGVAHCKNIAARRPDLPLDRLVRLLDYHKTVIESDDQLSEKCAMSDKSMYDSRPVDAEAYSVTLCRAFRTLVAVYFASRFTAAQIEELRLSKHGQKDDAVSSQSDDAGAVEESAADCGAVDVQPATVQCVATPTHGYIGVGAMTFSIVDAIDTQTQSQCAPTPTHGYISGGAMTFSIDTQTQSQCAPTTDGDDTRQSDGVDSDGGEQDDNEAEATSSAAKRLKFDDSE